MFTKSKVGLGLAGIGLGVCAWFARAGHDAERSPFDADDAPGAYAETVLLDDMPGDELPGDELPGDDLSDEEADPVSNDKVSLTDAGGANGLEQFGLKPPQTAGSADLHPVLGHTLNVLLLGLDKNPGVRRGGLTDTLIVAALDTEHERLGLVSIPRDLYVSVENHGQTRVNAVYALARKDKLEPTAAFDRVLRDTLGIPIQHTVIVDLGLFERVIDELGGVDVQVPCAIKDRFIDARVEGGRRLLDVAAGNQHLDGVTAAMYVRSRHGRSDWSRARRQQAVLLGLRDKVTQPEVLLHVPDLLGEWTDSVTTDLSTLQVIGLVRKVAGLKIEDLHGVVLGHKETLPTRNEKQWSVLMPDNEAISQRLNDMYSAALPGHGTERCVDPDVALRHKAKRVSPPPDTVSVTTDQSSLDNRSAKDGQGVEGNRSASAARAENVARAEGDVHTKSQPAL